MHDTGDLIHYLAISAIPILLAITLHEAAHAYAARHFGDRTAERAGRITLNPLDHIDPIGTVLVPLVTLMISVASGKLFWFGWAKPVPVNFMALRSPKKDMLWVALAGPGSNFFMALCWALAARLALAMGSNFISDPLFEIAQMGVSINLVFMVLNLIPLPPLDGGRIAVSLLPHDLAEKYARIEPYGFMILLVLMYTHLLGLIMWPVVNWLQGMINYLFF